MLTPRTVEKLWSKAIVDSAVGRGSDVLRFARLVEAAALENATGMSFRLPNPVRGGRTAPVVAASDLRSKARAARKAAEENDDAAR